MPKKFAIIIGGCGHKDGTEIHEAVMTMLAVVQNGAQYEIFAPNRNQFHVVNHLTGEVTDEKRNLLVEAARIARGNIKPLEELVVSDFDALVLPGGYGAAKNFSDYAFKGGECTVDSQIASVIKDFAKTGKPLGGLCIAPVLLVKVLGNVTVTIGKDEATAANVHKMGGANIDSDHGDVIVDKRNNIFSTPCYMLDANILQSARGADNLIKAMMESGA